MLYNLTISSTKFPGITAYCPVRPIPGGGKGTFEFKSGITYPVEESTMLAVQQHVAAQEPYIKNFVQVTATPIGGAGHTAQLIKNPGLRVPPKPVGQQGSAVDLSTITEELPVVLPTVTDDDEIIQLEQAIAEELTELSSDDEDLIEVEISKLRDLTIAQAEPVVLNVATNPSFPLLVRVTYLERVSGDKTFQKGLREMANNTLKQISPSEAE